MAITRNDCILLLSDLQKNGVDIKDNMSITIKNKFPQIEVVDFINKNRPLEITAFYEKLRNSYNKKKSVLYKNIVKIDEGEPKEVLTTLASLNLQVLLFSKQCSDQNMFLNHARFNEISAVMYNYSKTFDLIPCIKLLTIVKADLKAFESIKNN